LGKLPPPNIAGLIEIRNVGLASLPCRPRPGGAGRCGSIRRRRASSKSRMEAIMGGGCRLLPFIPAARPCLCAPNGLCGCMHGALTLFTFARHRAMAR
jgi:hypothetical protein